MLGSPKLIFGQISFKFLKATYKIIFWEIFPINQTVKSIDLSTCPKLSEYTSQDISAASPQPHVPNLLGSYFQGASHILCIITPSFQRTPHPFRYIRGVCHPISFIWPTAPMATDGQKRGSVRGTGAPGAGSGSSLACDTTTLSLLERATDELRGSVLEIDAGSVQRAVELLSRARHVATYGVGREGLAMRGFAMRLHHLGVFSHVSVVGDVTACPLDAGDVLVVSAGPGFFPTVDAIVRTALRAGACVICVTAHPAGATPSQCDLVVHVPARTMADGHAELSGGSEECVGRVADGMGVLPMGSAYEGALFVLFEVMVYQLRTFKKVDEETMRSRHTNLE